LVTGLNGEFNFSVKYLAIFKSGHIKASQVEVHWKELEVIRLRKSHLLTILVDLVKELHLVCQKLSQ
jgi:hypothetical protein